MVYLFFTTMQFLLIIKMGSLNKEDRGVVGIDCKKMIYLRLTKTEKNLLNELSIKRANALILEGLLNSQNTFCRTQANGGDFNVITNNCEHFAIYCKTGEKKSVQTETLEKMLNAVQTTGKSLRSCCFPCC